MGVICLSCQSENTATAKFCLKCGSPMPVAAAAPSQGDGSSPPVTPPPQATRIETPFGGVRVGSGMMPPPPPPLPTPPPITTKPPVTGGANTTTTPEKPKSKSKIWMILGIIVVILVGLGLLGSQDTPQPTSATTPPAQAEVAQSIPAPSTANPSSNSQGVSVRDMFNQLLGLARDNRWAEVPGSVASLKAMSSVQTGDRSASDQILAQARDIFNTDPAGAEQLLLDAILADGSNAEARFLIARSLLAQKKVDAATVSLIDGLTIGPDLGSGWFAAAEVFAETNRAEAAISSLKLAVFYANDRERALNYLRNADTNISSAPMREIVKTALPTLAGVPRQR